jgi:hypothetical protein
MASGGAQCGCRPRSGASPLARAGPPSGSPSRCLSPRLRCVPHSPGAAGLWPPSGPANPPMPHSHRGGRAPPGPRCRVSLQLMRYRSSRSKIDVPRCLSRCRVGAVSGSSFPRCRHRAGGAEVEVVGVRGHAEHSLDVGVVEGRGGHRERVNVGGGWRVLAPKPFAGPPKAQPGRRRGDADRPRGTGG